jgi:hypothetical protein
MASGDKESFAQGKMEESDLVGDAVDLANEIGEDPEQTAPDGIQLLMVIGTDEQLAGRSGKNDEARRK